MLRNNKGLTILELIVAIALSSLVIMLAVQMYLTNTANFKVNEQQAELTSVANQILTSISEVGIESSGVFKIEISEENDEENKLPPSIKFLEFRDSGTRITYDSNILEIGSQTFEDVTRFVVMPIPEDKDFEDANGIKVLLEVESTKGRRPISYEATTIIGFRNR